MKLIFLLMMLFFELYTVLENYTSECGKKLFESMLFSTLLILAINNVYQYVDKNDGYRWGINYLNSNRILANYIQKTYNTNDSLLLQSSPVRGYDNLLFNRGIYEGITVRQGIDIASEKEIRYVIELANEPQEWTMDKYNGCMVYDLKKNTDQIIKISNEKIITSINKTFFAYELTDDNWEKGVSINSGIILVSNNKFNLNKFEDAKELKVNGTIKKIKEIDQNNEWIYIMLEDNKEVEKFKFPNRIEVIKNN
ncbi:hypothetical protein MT361_19595 [Clostridium butyricum]|nr:hypothetical protein [Clostridium butyricum]